MIADGPPSVPIPDGSVDLVRGDVFRDGRPCGRLTARDLELLAYLVEHPGEDLSRGRLATEVLGQPPGTVSRAVDAAVYRLRTKVERDPTRPVSLITVQACGYRWVPPAAPVRSLLPPPREELIPRPALWAQIEAAVARGRCALVGPPGIGKSTAAVAWARSRAFPGGALRVDLAGQTRPEGAARAVARALGLPAEGTPGARVGHALASRGEALVILDGVEEEVVADVLASWRARAPAVRWLLTSRTRPPWPSAEVVLVEPLPVEDGVALFELRAQAVRVGLGPRDDDGAVRALVRALDGVPLAIELAASRTAALSPAQLLDRLPAGLRLLDPSGRGPHGGLRAAIAQSWTLLSADDQRVFAQLSVFAAVFGVDAARSVVGDAADEAIAGLVRRSLVVAVGGGEAGGRFQLLQSLRAFAAERLAQMPDDQRDAFRRHGLWFTRGAQQVQREVLGREGVAWARRLAAERDDLQLVVDRFGDDDPRLAAWAVVIAHPGVVRGEHDEAFERTALELAERLYAHPGESLALSCALQRVAAYVCRRQGRFAEAEALLARGAALAEQVDDHTRIRIVADRCGTAINAGRLEEGVRWGEAARDEAERIGDEPLLGLVLADLAVGLKQLGRIDEAVAGYERALAVLERTGCDLMRGLVLANLGVLDAEHGRTDLARRRFEEAAALHRVAGNLRSSGIALLNLGLIDDEQGDLHLALDRYHQALDVMVRTGSRRFEGLCRANLGGALGRSGRPVAARQHLRRAKQIAIDLDLPRDSAIADGELGVVAWAEGKRTEAIGLFQSAAALPAGPRYEALYRGFLGALLGLERDRAAGLHELALAREAAERSGDPSLAPVLARMDAILAAPAPPPALPPAGRGWWGRYAEQRLREVIGSDPR